MSDPDRTRLPIRRPPFGGVCNKTLAGSEPDWNLIGHPEPPPGSPNVLLVLIDDAGFGNAGTFGGPIDTPNYSRMAEGFYEPPHDIRHHRANPWSRTALTWT
jgi:hypothetical protein